MLSWIYTPESWSFDVSSLMVLIGESEELSYRLSQRSLLECLVAAPVVGLQSYIRSYDLLIQTGSFTYYSPYGCKWAPLRNNRLENAITTRQLLGDNKFSVFNIRSKCLEKERLRLSTCLIAMWLWFLFTWMFFSGLILCLFLMKSQQTSWIGLVNCIALSSWSIIVRVIEYHLVRPAPRSEITRPDDDCAMFILGRSSSAFVLEGRRSDIKDWTARGLSYDGDSKSYIPVQALQAFTRLVSSLVLVFIFTSIPNGTTMDQIIFILLNALGQINVLVGRSINSWAYLMRLEKLDVSQKSVPSRTHIMALLLRRYKHVGRGDCSWFDISGIAPKTEIWDEWKRRVVVEEKKDPKKLYNEIHGEMKPKIPTYDSWETGNWPSS